MNETLYRPSSGLCPWCSQEFVYKVREQGGGKLAIYCSAKCRSLDWARSNAVKRKATVLKYEAVPENKEKKRQQSRRRLYKKYGWTEARFKQQLVRQQNSCAGCLVKIDEETARIDHCHTTNKVRGLLCDRCNWALGHARDDAAILRRLMAYTERDLDKTMVYLTGALKNPRIPVLGNTLRGLGFDVMDEWHTPGPHADENWQAYEAQRGRTYNEALRGRAATNVFLFDRAYLDLSDIVILVMPAGKSAMLELGYAKGRGKESIIYLDGEEPDRYDVMPGFADHVVKTEEELLVLLGGNTNGGVRP